MTNIRPIDEALDPQTIPARLAELASNHPETQVAIASHPAAYEGLLRWLAEHGSNEVRAAIEARTRVNAVPPPPPEQPTVAAAVTASPTKPRFTAKSLLLVGGAIAVVGALVASTAIAVPAILSLFGGDPSEITVADFETEPAAGIWSLDHPFAGDVSGYERLGAKGTTVGQDLAAVIWTISNASAVDSYESALSLVNTRTGEELWQVNPGRGSHIVTTSLERERIVTSVPDEGLDSTWTVYDLADGAALAAVNAQGFWSSPTSLDGDFLGRGEGGTTTRSRYDIDTLEQVWSMETGGARTWLGVNTVVVGADVYSAEDGSLLSWQADEEASYGQFDGFFVSISYAGDTRTISRIDEKSGEKLWSVLTLSGGWRPIPDQGLLIWDELDGTISLIRWQDGETVWTIDGTIYDSAHFRGGSVEAGVIALPISENSGNPTAVDASTGERLYDIGVPGGDSRYQHQLASTEQSLYLTGGPSEQFVALDARTGTVRWTVENPFEGSYLFDVWGGNPVAWWSGNAFSEEPYPGLIGIG